MRKHILLTGVASGVVVFATAAQAHRHEAQVDPEITYTNAIDTSLTTSSDYTYTGSLSGNVLLTGTIDVDSSAERGEGCRIG